MGLSRNGIAAYPFIAFYGITDPETLAKLYVYVQSANTLDQNGTILNAGRVHSFEDTSTA